MFSDWSWMFYWVERRFEGKMGKSIWWFGSSLINAVQMRISSEDRCSVTEADCFTERNAVSREKWGNQSDDLGHLRSTPFSCGFRARIDVPWLKQMASLSRAPVRGKKKTINLMIWIISDQRRSNADFERRSNPSPIEQRSERSVFPPSRGWSGEPLFNRSRRSMWVSCWCRSLFAWKDPVPYPLAALRTSDPSTLKDRDRTYCDGECEWCARFDRWTVSAYRGAAIQYSPLISAETGDASGTAHRSTGISSSWSAIGPVWSSRWGDRSTRNTIFF